MQDSIRVKPSRARRSIAASKVLPLTGSVRDQVAMPLPTASKRPWSPGVLGALTAAGLLEENRTFSVTYL